MSLPTIASSTSLSSDSPQSIKLSAREVEVLKLIVEGRTNPEIAAVLYLSPNTIKTHVRGILNKFGVEDRLQASVFAVRHHLV